MAFDRTKPVNGTKVDADFLRGQFNDADDRIVSAHQRIDQNDADDAATNARIDQTNADVTATNARIDAIPPAFPHGGDAVINGSLQTNGLVNAMGGLGIELTDVGGSGESGIGIGSDSAGGVPVISIAHRASGATAFQIKLDFGGLADGSGTPTIQHADLFTYDQPSGTLKPTRGLAARFADLAPLNLTVSDPPTQTEMQTIATRLDEYLARFQGM